MTNLDYKEGRGDYYLGEGRREERVRRERAARQPCIFPECVSTDRHFHGPFPGGHNNPADPDGPPIPFTAEPVRGARDYNGALLPGSGEESRA